MNKKLLFIFFLILSLNLYSGPANEGFEFTPAFENQQRRWFTDSVAEIPGLKEKKCYTSFEKTDERFLSLHEVYLPNGKITSRTSISLSPENTRSIANTSWEYDKNGSPIRIIHLQDGLLNYSVEFTYEEGRLVRAFEKKGDGTIWDISWHYDQSNFIERAVKNDLLWIEKSFVYSGSKLTEATRLEYDEGGIVVSERMKQLEYNEDGFLVCIKYRKNEEDIFKSGEYSAEQKYIYDTAGNIVEDIFSTSDSGVVDNNQYVYDPEGKLLEQIVLAISYPCECYLGTHRFSYDSNGRPLESEFITANDFLNNISVYEYKNDGSLLIKLFEHDYHSEDSYASRPHSEQLYNKANALVSEIRFDSKGNVLKRKEIEYDEKGVILSETIWEEGQLSFIDTEYTHYEQ